MSGLLILTEAGESRGFGHFMRCCAIQQAMQQQNYSCELLLDLQGENSLASSNHHITSWLEDKGKVITLAQKFSVVLVDSYQAPASYYHFLQSYFSAVAVIDDYQRLEYQSDLLINPNLGGEEFSYPQEKMVLAGKDFIILRDAFRNSSPRLKVESQINDILLTIGGGDARNLLPLLLPALPSNYQINVVVGQQSYKKRLQQKYPDKHLRFVGPLTDQQMRQAMEQADIAIATAGQTLHELAYLGIPTIGICVAENQVFNMRKYVELGFLPDYLSWNDPELTTKIIYHLQCFQSPLLRQQTAQMGMGYVNGQGVEKISQHLAELMKRI